MSHGRLCNPAAERSLLEELYFAYRHQRVVPVLPNLQSDWPFSLRNLNRGQSVHLATRPITSSDSVAITRIPVAENGAEEDIIVVALPRDQLCTEQAFSYLTDRQKLSPAEKRVLRGLIDGQRAKSIAYSINRSEHTVRTQIRSVLSKFRVGSVPNLILLFARLP